MLDVGALHSRAGAIDARGRVSDYKMTSQCASGSGQFLENIARYLGVSHDEIGPLSLEGQQPEKVSSICAVLAETDVINMVSRGTTTANILGGVLESMADRFARLLMSLEFEGPVFVSGGLAGDTGLLAAIRDALHKKLPADATPWEVVSHPDAIFSGAIGAALWGAFRHRKVARARWRGSPPAPAPTPPPEVLRPMTITATAYHRPATLAEACALGQELGPGAAFLAGGTELVPDYHRGRETARHLIALDAIEELRGIRQAGKVLRIGALTTVAEVARSPLLREWFPVLAEAARANGSPQIRNLATIGGNFCRAVPCADTPPAAIVAGARVRLFGPSGGRELEAERFFTGPRQTVLQPGEVLVEILVPSQPPHSGASLKPYPYDPEQAKQLLDEAGWKDSDGDGIRDKEIDGQKVDLMVRYITNQRELRKSVLAVVQQQWSLVGIGAELVNYSSDIFWNGYNDGGPQALGDYDIAEYSSVQTAFPDPDASAGFSCDQICNADNPDGGNQQGYCNPDLDVLLKEQAVTLDPKARKEMYNQIQQIIYDDYIYVGMWKDPDLWSINDRVQNVKLSGVYPFWNANEWVVAATTEEKLIVTGSAWP